jgi:hypothetical protein
MIILQPILGKGLLKKIKQTMFVIRKPIYHWITILGKDFFKKKRGGRDHDTPNKIQLLCSNTSVKDVVCKKANENLQVNERANLHVSSSSTSWSTHSSVTAIKGDGSETQIQNLLLNQHHCQPPVYKQISNGKQPELASTNMTWSKKRSRESLFYNIPAKRPSKMQATRNKNSTTPYFLIHHIYINSQYCIL